jgi:hypothetical protein
MSNTLCQAELCLPLAFWWFLLGLLSDPDEGCSTLLWNISELQNYTSYKSEDCTLHSHCCKNFKLNTTTVILYFIHITQLNLFQPPGIFHFLALEWLPRHTCFLGDLQCIQLYTQFSLMSNVLYPCLVLISFAHSTTFKQDLKVQDNGTLKQLLTFWTLSIILS